MTERRETELTLHAAEVVATMDDTIGGDGLLANAGVVVDGSGTIVEVGPLAGIAAGWDRRVDHAVLMPGVVNCHVHMTDATIDEPVPGGRGLNAWVRELIARRHAENGARSGGGAPGSTPVTGTDRSRLDAAILRTIDRMRESGTVAIGEVCNTLETLEAIERSGIRCRFIHELLAFPVYRAESAMEAAERAFRENFPRDRIAHTLGAHAPYSVSPALMERVIDFDRRHGTRVYEHLAEDPAERELYGKGTGPWHDFLEEIGAWEPRWQPFGESPIAFLDRRGWLDENFVAVHLADATDAELLLMAERGAMAILSPTSNVHITGLMPRFETIVSSGLRFGLGTDGRGSNPYVDVFHEAALLHAHFGSVRPGVLLRALTVDGAIVLDLDGLGVLRPGTRPGFVSVDLDRPTTELAALESAILVAEGHRSLHGYRVSGVGCRKSEF